MLRGVRTALSFMSRRERTVYFFLLSIRALSGFLDVLGIALIGLLAGLAATSLDPAKPLVVLGITVPIADQRTLLILVLVVLFVFAVKAVIAVWLSRVMTKFLARIESEKAVEVAQYLFGGNLGDLHQLTKGEILWALQGSTAYGFSGLLNSLTTFTTEGMLLFLIAGTFFLVDPVATLFVFVYFGIIIFLIQLVIGRSLKKAGRDASEGNMEGTVVIDDYIGAFREISVLHKRDFFIEKFQRSRLRVAQSSATMSFLGGMPRYVVETALMLGVVIFVGWQFITGQLASGLITVGVFLTGGVRIMASLLPLQNAAANAKNQLEQSRVGFEMLTLAKQASQVNSPAVKTEGQKILLEQKALGVDIAGVSFKYFGSDELALKNINVHISPGQHVAVIGPSGAGKTTLVDLILGLVSAEIGAVSIGGESPEAITRKAPGLISYVPQKPGIVSGTLKDNIALGIAPEDIDLIQLEAVIEAANLTEFINSLPEGINSSVGTQADSLSGGQIQRIGLARALYHKPKLIILDEATSALDAGSEAFVSSSLQALGKDVTVIVIAHRLSTVQYSDVVFVMESGEIVASGKFAELRKTVPMVAEYVRLMSFED